MKPEDRYTFSMSCSMVKQGSEDSPVPFDATINYRSLDYGQLVGVEALLAKLGEGLVGLGVAEAENIGFDMSKVLPGIKGQP